MEKEDLRTLIDLCLDPLKGLINEANSELCRRAQNSPQITIYQCTELIESHSSSLSSSEIILCLSTIAKAIRPSNYEQLQIIRKNIFDPKYQSSLTKLRELIIHALGNSMINIKNIGAQIFALLLAIENDDLLKNISIMSQFLGNNDLIFGEILILFELFSLQNFFVVPILNKEISSIFSLLIKIVHIFNIPYINDPNLSPSIEIRILASKMLTMFFKLTQSLYFPYFESKKHMDTLITLIFQVLPPSMSINSKKLYENLHQLLSVVVVTQYDIVTSETSDYRNQILGLYSNSALLSKMETKFYNYPLIMWKEIAQKELLLICQGKTIHSLSQEFLSRFLPILFEKICSLSDSNIEIIEDDFLNDKSELSANALACLKTLYLIDPETIEIFIQKEWKNCIESYEWQPKYGILAVLSSLVQEIPPFSFYVRNREGAFTEYWSTILNLAEQKPVPKIALITFQIISGIIKFFPKIILGINKETTKQHVYVLIDLIKILSTFMKDGLLEEEKKKINPRILEAYSNILFQLFTLLGKRDEIYFNISPLLDDFTEIYDRINNLLNYCIELEDTQLYSSFSEVLNSFIFALPGTISQFNRYIEIILTDMIGILNQSTNFLNSFNQTIIIQRVSMACSTITTCCKKKNSPFPIEIANNLFESVEIVLQKLEPSIYREGLLAISHLIKCQKELTPQKDIQNLIHLFRLGFISGNYQVVSSSSSLVISLCESSLSLIIEYLPSLMQLLNECSKDIIEKQFKISLLSLILKAVAVVFRAELLLKNNEVVEKQIDFVSNFTMNLQEYCVTQMEKEKEFYSLSAETIDNNEELFDEYVDSLEALIMSYCSLGEVALTTIRANDQEWILNFFNHLKNFFSLLSPMRLWPYHFVFEFTKCLITLSSINRKYVMKLSKSFSILKNWKKSDKLDQESRNCASNALSKLECM